MGNLRTALVAWLSTAAAGGAFVIRMEDLDPVTSSPVHAARQLADLTAIGIESDVAVVHQSERFDRYRDAIADLDRRGLVYSCFCTRREIREAAGAPHGEAVPDGAYPGTCRELSASQRRARVQSGRPAALRLRTGGESYAFVDRIAGACVGTIDDVVLQRNDGTPAYNLAVVLDDHAQSVTEVVRGDDLLSSTPRQIHLQQLLGLDTPAYAHVPLVVGADGERLAKRHRATTLADWIDGGHGVGDLVALLAIGLGCPPPTSTPTAELRAVDIVGAFAWDRVPRTPWTWAP